MYLGKPALCYGKKIIYLIIKTSLILSNLLAYLYLYLNFIRTNSVSLFSLALPSPYQLLTSNNKSLLAVNNYSTGTRYKQFN